MPRCPSSASTFFSSSRAAAPRFFVSSCAFAVRPDLIDWISFFSRSISSVLRSMRSSSAEAASPNSMISSMVLPYFFLEFLDQVEPVADLFQPVGVEFHAVGIGRDLVRRFLELRPSRLAELERRRKTVVDGRDLPNIASWPS